LGLGGEPRLLGRASDIETFVMNGEDVAEIEIEIVNTKGDNPIITRILRRDGSGPKSSFLWNGSPVSGKTVRESCLTKYHIVVNNLCTFLPQDRVGSFSGFDAKQLLIETEKSLSSSQHLYNTHQELIKDQLELQGGSSQVGTLQDKLSQLQVENARLEREKQRMEERQIALEQAELLRKKLLWLRFEEKRTYTLDKRTEKIELKEELKEAVAKVKPLEEAHKEAEQEMEQVDEQYKMLDKQIQKHQKDMQKQTQKYENHDDGIETTLQELHAMDSQRATLEQRVQQRKEDIEKYEHHIEQLPPLATLTEELQQAQQDHKGLSPRYEEAKRDVRQLHNQIREVEENRKHQQGKLNKLQDEKARRCERIFRQQPQLRQVFEWLQNNRNLFRKQVIGPIMCEITTQSNNAAAYLEQHVPNSTLKSFIVQGKDDYDLLYRKVRGELKLPINIIIIDHVKPPAPRLYSDNKMQVLKREHGVIGFMDESFTAPDLVVQALKTMAAIEKVLVGTDQTQKSLDNHNLLNYLAESENGDSKLKSCCIFASEGDRSSKYNSQISKYSGKPSLRVDDIRAAKWLAKGVNEKAKQDVQQELDSINQQLGELQPAAEAAQQNVAELQEGTQKAMEKVKSAKTNMSDLQKLINKKRNAERKHQESVEQLSLDNEGEKKEKIGVLNNRIRHSLVALEAQAESYKRMMIATVKCSGARLNREVVANKERELR
jgi:chromosome segregation ATPase